MLLHITSGPENKEALKKVGGTWNPSIKKWLVPKNKEAVQLAQKLDLSIEVDIIHNNKPYKFHFPSNIKNYSETEIKLIKSVHPIMEELHQLTFAS